MTDSADRLAAAIREIINQAVDAALRTQSPPEPPKMCGYKESEHPSERMLYPLKEVQHRLGLSRTTVYQLIGDGQLPSVKIGRRRFVAATALDAYVKALHT